MGHLRSPSQTLNLWTAAKYVITLLYVHRLVPPVEICDHFVLNMAGFTFWETAHAEELQDYVKQNGVSRVDEYISRDLTIGETSQYNCSMWCFRSWKIFFY